MHNQYLEEAVDSLMKQYGKYGMERETIASAMRDGMENYGLSLSAAFNGLRMSLATVFGEHENFTIEDVMDITGENREEVIKRIEEMREETAASGDDPDDYARLVTVGKEIYSNGVTQGNLEEIEEMVSLIVEIGRREGHDRRFLIRCAQDLFGQFGIPIEKRNLMKVIQQRGADRESRG